MSSSFDTIKARIRAELREAVAVSLLDDDLFLYVKEARNLLYKIILLNKQELLETVATTALTEDDYYLTIPTNTLHITEVLAVSQDDSGEDSAVYELKNYDMPTVRKSQMSSGIPICYHRLVSTLQLGPKLNGDYNIEIYYIPTMTELTAYSSYFSPIPDAFVDLIVEYVVIRANNSNNRQTIVEQQFMNLKSDIIRAMLVKSTPITYVRKSLNDYYPTGY